MYEQPKKTNCLLCKGEVTEIEFAQNNGLCNTCRDGEQGHDYKLDGYECWRLQITLKNAIRSLRETSTVPTGIKTPWEMLQFNSRKNRRISNTLEEFCNLLENLDDDIPSCENCEERRGEPEYDEGRD